MNDHRVLWLSAPDRHRECVKHQARLHARSHAPANDLAREQVKHNRQVQPTLVGANVGDVCGPGLVDAIGRKLSVQMVVATTAGLPPRPPARRR